MQCKRCPSYEVTLDPEGITWRRCRWDGHQVYDNMECDAHSIKIKAFLEAKEEMRKETHMEQLEIINLVLVRHTMLNNGEKYLFRCPLGVELKSGEEVRVETSKGIASAWVIDTCSARVGSRAYEFILKTIGAKHPLKRVLYRVRYEDIKYHDGEWEAEDVQESD